MPYFYLFVNQLFRWFYSTGTVHYWYNECTFADCIQTPAFVYICLMRMTISGLPRHFDKFDLQRLFNEFGWVEYTKILIDPLSGLSKGKGIVGMNDESAKKAIATLQGK